LASGNNLYQPTLFLRLLAETTLVAAGLLVSTFDFTDLLLVGAAVFLLRDFFSIAIVVFSGFLIELLYA
jgi:hypothetical protein